MVRVVGGIILTRIGFGLFAPSPQGGLIPSNGSGTGAKEDDVAFIPLAMPIMFGPGAIATILGMVSTVKQSTLEVESFVAISLAIVATMAVTYLSLVYSKVILKKVGPKGIDAATRIVGFFVAAMGMGLVFHGIVEFLQTYGVVAGHIGAG
jgi:multiple antibiotic resistance protein